MKKYLVYLLLILLASGQIFAGGNGEAETKKTILTFGHIFAPDTLPGKGGYKFVEILAEKSGGQMEVIYKPGAALGDERAHIEQVTTGTIDIMVTGDGMIASNAPDFAVMTMPFVFRDAEHAMKVRAGAIGQRLNEAMLKDAGVKIMGWQNIGARQLTSNVPVYTLADLKGLKMRLPDVKWWIKAWEKTGASVATVAFNELYLALQTGTVDAEENPADFVKGQKFYEVQDYIILTNHVQNINGWYMNEKRYQSLTAEQKTWIEESITEAAAWVTEEAKAADKSAMNFLKTEGGMTVIEPDFSGLQDLLKNLPMEVGGKAAQQLYNDIQAVK
jgi:TRAP-type transport system periplasmic protein